MAGVLIEMRAAILRRSTTASRGRMIGGLALVLFVTLLAVATLLTGLTHYHYRGAGAAVVATLSFGWLLGWVTGPLLTGDDAALRMDYFKLLPIPARKLAFALLGAAFANVSLVFVNTSTQGSSWGWNTLQLLKVGVKWKIASEFYTGHAG